MAISHLATGYERATRPTHGPWIAFSTALAAAAATGGMAARTSPELIAPAVALSLFILAAAVALFGWRRRRSRDAPLTYWDVAGVLTLIGVCAATAVEPTHLTQVVFGPIAP